MSLIHLEKGNIGTVLNKYLIRPIKHSAAHLNLLYDRPSIIPRVLNGYFKTLVLRKNVLRVVEFVVNYECQSRCTMCFASKNEKPNQKPLSPYELADVWKQAEKLGAVASVIEGGEATLRKDLPDIIRSLNGKRNICNLITNAIGLDKNYLRNLKDVGLSSICFSLDGSESETNDRIRGYKGHFDQVMRCIEWSKDVGISVYIAPTFSHGELPKVKKIIKLVLDKGCKVSASTAVLSGEWAGKYDNKLDDKEWDEIRAILKKHPQVRFDWNINYSLRYECPGGREKICVGIYGDVHGCATNPISFGNVREKSLETIWRRMQTFQPFYKRSPICLVSEEEDYIRTFIDPISGIDEHPISIDKHPNTKARRFFIDK